MSRAITKRAMPLLLALLLVTLMVAVPAHATIEITDVEDTEGNAITSGDYGDTVVVKGRGVTAGKEVRLYWDLVQDWDGEAGLLNTTKADKDGTFEVWFDVPEAVAGTHYIWVEDVESSLFDSVTFTVLTLIDPSITSGLERDRVTVDGYGFGAEEYVALLLVDTTEGNEEDTDTLIEAWDGTETTVETTLEYAPIEPGSVVISASGGVGTLLEDAGNGKLVGDGEGTIDYVTGDIEFTLESTTFYGTVEVTCTYDYFEDETDKVYVFATNIETNEVGSFSRTVRVPYEDDMGTGTYTLYAFDGEGNYDTETFKIGAVISLSVDEGPTGTVVEIRGEGFEGVDTIEEGDIKLGTEAVGYVDCQFVEEEEEVEVEDGEFEVEVVIPIPPDEDTGDYEIKVTAGGYEASADFEVTGLPGITFTPEYGAPGDIITIEGENFTQIEDAEVTLSSDDWTETFELEEDGTFSGTFSVPALDDATYTFTATDEYGLSAEEDFRVSFIIAVVTPDEAETGELLTLMGRGFTENGEWNASLSDGTVLVEDGSVDEYGTFLEPVTLPTVPEGDYEVIFWDVDAEIQVTVPFTVTHSTTITLDPDTAPAGYNVTVTGAYFTHDAGTKLEWVLYNVTETGEVAEDWDLNVWICWGRWVEPPGEWEGEEEVTTTDDGDFEGWFIVPELDPGIYYINCTDDNDLYAQAVLTVIEEVINIRPTKDEFHRGEVLSFTVESSFPKRYDIKVYDPDDNLYSSIPIYPYYFVKTDTLWMIPAGYLYFFELPSDAPLGTYFWEAIDVVAEEVVANGTFTVLESVEAYREDIVELNETVTGLKEDISGLKEDISGIEEDVSGVKEDISGLKEDVSGVKEDISGLKEDISGVKEDISELAGDVAAAAKAAEEASKSVSELADVVSEVADTASSAKSAAEEAKAAAEEAKTAASGLTPLIYGAIGVSLIAALAAIVSLIQLSRRIAG